MPHDGHELTMVDREVYIIKDLAIDGSSPLLLAAFKAIDLAKTVCPNQGLI
jgi:hypothetical protein